MEEIWRDIKGYEGLYQVSNMGQVRGLDRMVYPNNRKAYVVRGRILIEGFSKKNRKHVQLCKDGNKERAYTHVLVAETFLGKRPDGYHICHKDGNHLNNRLDNLRYDTPKENNIDQFRDGKRKGDAEKALEIRRLYNTGEYTQIELAKMFNKSGGNIHAIVHRHTFSWLNDDGTIDDSNTAVG